MKIDPDYFRGLLSAFEDAPEPTTDIEWLQSQGYDFETDAFVFHMEILADRHLIEQPDGDRGFGLMRSADGIAYWSILPLRLTANGHEALASIQDPEAWKRTKDRLSKVGKFGLDVMLSVAKAYTKQVLHERLHLDLG